MIMTQYIEKRREQMAKIAAKKKKKASPAYYQVGIFPQAKLKPSQKKEQ